MTSVQVRASTPLSRARRRSASALANRLSAATMPLISEPTARAVGVAEVPPGTERFVTILCLGGPEVFPLRDIPRLSAGNVGLRDVPVAHQNVIYDT